MRRECESCAGKGVVEDENDVPVALCSTCRGTGSVGCDRCDGSGWLEASGPHSDGSYATSRPCPSCN
jgi:DnaJ-class molecular chaperone